MNEDEFRSNDKSDDKPAMKPKKKTGVIALKDHILFSPPSIPEKIEIKEGDDLTKILEEIPETFKTSLITEGVLKGK